jgi:hypothetical protein
MKQNNITKEFIVSIKQRKHTMTRVKGKNETKQRHPHRKKHKKSPFLLKR